MWVWAGHSTKDLPKGIELYLHQATLQKQRHSTSEPLFVRQGLGPVLLKNNPLLLTYRIESLSSAAPLLRQFLDDKLRWELRENKVIGLQIDFDSPTHKLLAYISFLKEVRQSLDSSLRLSVTGLADWGSSANPNELQELFQVTNEVIFQLYQGRSALRDLQTYSLALAKLPYPFLVGVLKGDEHLLPEILLKADSFKGIVIFEVVDREIQNK